MTTKQKPTGYTDCPCRDCFEIAMDGDLCHDCEESGCDEQGNEECQSPHAYGGFPCDDGTCQDCTYCELQAEGY